MILLTGIALSTLILLASTFVPFLLAAYAFPDVRYAPLLGGGCTVAAFCVLAFVFGPRITRRCIYGIDALRALEEQRSC